MTPHDPQGGALANLIDADESYAEAIAEDDELASHSISRPLDTIRRLTGLTTGQIREGFRADPSRTLAEQAAAGGVGQNALVSAIIADTRHRLDEAVAAGKITPKLADARLANLDTNVTDLVTRRFR